MNADDGRISGRDGSEEPDIEAELRAVAAHWVDSTPPAEAWPLASVASASDETRQRITLGLVAAAGLAIIVGAIGLIWLLPDQSSETVIATKPAMATPLAPVTAIPATATATAVPADAAPSQSSADAARDEVLAELAALSLLDRAEVIASVEIDGRKWIAARLPDGTRDVASAEQWRYPTGQPFDWSSSELLHVDRGRIVRALPARSMPLTTVVADGSVVVAFRIGDGGYPHSGVMRVDTSTGFVDRWIVPAPDPSTGVVDQDAVSQAYPDWTVVDSTTSTEILRLLRVGMLADDVAALNEALGPISG